MLGLKGEGNDAQDKAFQAYLQLAKNNHSAPQAPDSPQGHRRVQRGRGSGFWLGFVYPIARLGSGGLNAGTMEKAIEAIPKEMGNSRTWPWACAPTSKTRRRKGRPFAACCSLSTCTCGSAVVNMTQPFQITMPWLSQYGGMAKAGKQMARALKDMATKGFKYEPDLAKALQEAEDDGTVSPQEIHQLIGAGARHWVFARG